ncbi:hypothetical protein GJAV_G00094220 [Gymnothorax javanicus]|nr:hypothetical protein GJAV_G00094220 [Gymnothorax javanicus]
MKCLAVAVSYKASNVAWLGIGRDTLRVLAHQSTDISSKGRWRQAPGLPSLCHPLWCPRYIKLIGRGLCLEECVDARVPSFPNALVDVALAAPVA